MDDNKITNTAKVGYQPDIKQPVGKVTLKISAEDFKPPQQADQIAPEDAEKIQEFLEDFTTTREKLASLDSDLEKFLTTPQRIGDNGLPETFSIIYDPEKLPELAEAHHHICGRPGASNVITYNDIKARALTARAQARYVSGLPENLAEMSGMSAKDIEESLSKQLQKMIADMFNKVWRQVIIWALEVLAKATAPLKGIKFVKAVPKLFERAINRLKGNPNTTPLTFQQFADDVVGEEGELEGTAEELAIAGGGYTTASFKELAQELPPECLQHTATWNRVVDSLVRDGPYASAYYAKKVSEGLLDRMDNLNKLAAVGIPEGHAFTINGTEATYTNPLPEEYLQARADGSTKFSAFSDGLIDSVKQVKNTAIPKLERLVRNMAADPKLLCCLIRKLVLIATTGKDLKKALLLIKALLQFWRNLHCINISKELARLGNMIVDLLNQVLQQIFSTFNALFNNFLYKNVMGIADLREFAKDTSCKPWNEFINLAIEIADEAIQKVLSYLTGFFLQFRLDVQFSAKSLEELEKLSAIDKYLDLIEKVLRFAAAWEACIESENDKKTINNIGNDRLYASARGLTLAPASATNKAQGLYNELAASATTEVGSVPGATARSAAFAESGPFSADGVQVLLTNFLGVDNATAQSVLNSVDDCRCDNAFSQEELARIQQAIKEKT